jgi:hypothetical protein
MIKSIALFCVLVAHQVVAVAQPTDRTGVAEWWTVSSNSDSGYRRTQFFTSDYNTVLVDVDSRIEFWLPPYRSSSSWGPFVRLAAIDSSRDQPWENAWFGRPGVGVQMFPFSDRVWRKNKTGRLLGPLRIFGEYNFIQYWGDDNRWRPTRQQRFGIDYWRGLHVNSHARAWWVETWDSLSWSSSNEFDKKYDTAILANTLRLGLRRTAGGAASALTPYLAAESSWTKNDQYYWENRLLAGGGVRVAPVLQTQKGGHRIRVTRLVLYGEYLRAAAYYGVTPSSAIPRFDVRFGASLSIGDWYK